MFQNLKNKLLLKNYMIKWNNVHLNQKLIKLVKGELEQNGKFPTKIEVGPDYHNMIPIVRSI